MWTKFSAWWNSLPHAVQAVIVAGGGAALGVLEPVVEQWASGTAVCTVAVGTCVKGYIISAAKAAVLAVMGLYIKSSLYQPKGK
jgi:hypothetical protein